MAGVGWSRPSSNNMGCRIRRSKGDLTRPRKFYRMLRIRATIKLRAPGHFGWTEETTSDKQLSRIHCNGSTRQNHKHMGRSRDIDQDTHRPRQLGKRARIPSWWEILDQ